MDQLAAVTSNYTYDNIYQLTLATQGGSTTESYSYDPVGNRTASLGVSSYTTNASNEMTANSNASYTYDSNGNTLTKTVGSDTTTYAWDYENRLTSVILPGSGGTVSFEYDPFGMRIYKELGSAVSVYAYDGDNLIEETNSSGTAVARYAQGLKVDEPLAMLRSSTTSYYDADGLGSVTSLANGSGTLTQTYTYDSFGKVSASSGSLVNPFQYAAREADTESGLYYYRARYYDQQIGRFTTEDPLRHDPEDFYLYTENNPVLWVDPLGLWTCATYANCSNINPDLSAALDRLEQCYGKPLTVTCGSNGHQPTVDDKGIGHGDPHFYGNAVDVGQNANPGLSISIFTKCFLQSFPQKNPNGSGWGSYAQPEYNDKDHSNGIHFHIQYFGGALGGSGVSPYTHENRK